MQLRSLNPFSDPLNPGLIRAGYSWDGPRFFFNVSLEGLRNLEEEPRLYEVTKMEIRWKRRKMWAIFQNQQCEFLLHSTSSTIKIVADFLNKYRLLHNTEVLNYNLSKDSTNFLFWTPRRDVLHIYLLKGGWMWWRGVPKVLNGSRFLSSEWAEPPTLPRPNENFQTDPEVSR